MIQISQIILVIRRALALLPFLLILAACAGAATPPDSAAGITTAPPTATSPATAAVPLSIVSPDAPFAGPIIGFHLENNYAEMLLALFEPATGAFRELYSTLAVVAPYEARWFDDGCAIYANGVLYDLSGQIVWSAPEEIVARGIDLRDSQLSPDRAWLATLAGEAAAESGQRAVEVVRLSAPFDTFRLAERGGHPGALLWLADGDGPWLIFSAVDEDGLLQLYRARPDGGERQALTAHDAPVAQINAVAVSPDGARLAYAARNLVNPAQPYAYDAADEAWVGIVDLAGGDGRRVALPKLGAVETGRGLVWDEAGSRLLVIGDSLPLDAGDPLAGRQVHWLSAEGAVEQSLYQADTPSGQIGWVSPLGDIDTLLFSSGADIYRYEAGVLRRLEGHEQPPLGLELGRRPVGVLPATIRFGGEGGCGS